MCVEEESLSAAFLALYDRCGLSLSGAQASKLNHFFVAHDMTHVIAGISTSAEGEVALSAFQIGMDDNDINAGALLASLIAHEACFGTPGTFALESETLDSEQAAEVRGWFGVEVPDDPDDGHHLW